LFRPEFLSYVHKASETYGDLVRGHPLSFAVFRQAPWYQNGLLALEETQVSVRTPFLDNDLVRTAFRAPESAFANNDLRLRLIGDGNPALRHIGTDLGFGRHPGNLFGAATRAFHHFTMKSEYTYDYGMPQWMAQIDHLLSPFHFERLFLGRHKFYHFRIWYRDYLRDYVREILLDSRTLSRSYIQPKRLDAVVRGHLTGGHNYTTEIHKLLTLELLHRLFLDPK